MKSILQEKKECLITHQTTNLHKHHVFEGSANRTKSEKLGLTVWLVGDWHNLANYGVHFNDVLDAGLKDYAQRKYEEMHSHQSWMNEMHKDYLLDEPIFRNLEDFVTYGLNWRYFNEDYRESKK